MSNQKKKKSFLEQFDEDQKQIDKDLEDFNIDDFTTSPDELQKLVIPNFRVVKYKFLSYEETEQLIVEMKKKKVTDIKVRGMHFVAAMMHKADGKTTVKKLNKIPSHIANYLFAHITRRSSFLSPLSDLIHTSATKTKQKISS
jgi:hypothetical protein